MDQSNNNTQTPQDAQPQNQPPAPVTPQIPTPEPTSEIMNQVDEASTVDTPPSLPDTPPTSTSSLPGSNNKKTIAVAAAGISAILVILGVYAMTKESFKTTTSQYAASNETQTVSPEPTITTVEPSQTVTPSQKPATQDKMTLDQTTTSSNR